MRGGYRQNAGRKQGFSAKNAEEARRMLSEMVMREIIPIGEALIVKAKKGDISAIKELFDRSWGRSRQSFEIKTEETAEFKVDTQDPEIRAISKRYADEIRQFYSRPIPEAQE